MASRTETRRLQSLGQLAQPHPGPPRTRLLHHISNTRARANLDTARANFEATSTRTRSNTSSRHPRTRTKTMLNTTTTTTRANLEDEDPQDHPPPPDRRPHLPAPSRSSLVNIRHHLAGNHMQSVTFPPTAPACETRPRDPPPRYAFLEPRRRYKTDPSSLERAENPSCPFHQHASHNLTHNIPEGLTDFANFIRLGNIQDSLGEDGEGKGKGMMGVVGKMHGTMLMWSSNHGIGSIPQCQPTNAFLLPDEMECWPDALPPRGNATIFVHHEIGLASVNDAWQLLIACGESLAPIVPSPISRNTSIPFAVSTP
jgi:hypothetical protein